MTANSGGYEGKSGAEYVMVWVGVDDIVVLTNWRGGGKERAGGRKGTLTVGAMVPRPLPACPGKVGLGCLTWLGVIGFRALQAGPVGPGPACVLSIGGLWLMATKPFPLPPPLACKFALPPLIGQMDVPR